MRTPLRIAVAQPSCVSHDVAANARIHAATVHEARSRVVVFPELSLTGYELDAPAIDADDPRLAPIVDACAATGSVALVGAPVRGGEGRSHIAVLAVDGNGARVAYRKMWLGTAEARRFAPGGEPAMLDVDGWRLGLAVCRDTGVPRHAAETAAGRGRPGPPADASARRGREKAAGRAPVRDPADGRSCVRLGQEE